MIQICQLCKGTGKIMGMGCIVTKCYECNGVGSIETKDQEYQLKNDEVLNDCKNGTRRAEEDEGKQITQRRKKLHA